jgi:hypothetical protein
MDAAQIGEQREGRAIENAEFTDDAGIANDLAIEIVKIEEREIDRRSENISELLRFQICVGNPALILSCRSRVFCWRGVLAPDDPVLSWLTAGLCSASMAGSDRDINRLAARIMTHPASPGLPGP